MTEGRQGSFFFFSSRRRHTRLQGDWSSDVCSSDPGAGYRKPVLELLQAFSQATDIRAEASFGNMKQIETQARQNPEIAVLIGDRAFVEPMQLAERYITLGQRSEERRVGKEGRSRWSPYH